MLNLSKNARQLHKKYYPKFNENKAVPIFVTNGMHESIVETLALLKPVLDEVRVVCPGAYTKFMVATMDDIGKAYKDIFGYYPGYGPPAEE